MPRLDAIGGSSAGVYVDNRPMVASLFRGIPAERYDDIRTLFLRIRDEFGVPLEVINDGDVTALAGAMSLEDNGVLGIAMGSSEAAGYVNRHGAITGWLNELAFAPVDYHPAGAGRRVVGRHRRGRAVLLAAVRLPPGAGRSASPCPTAGSPRPRSSSTSRAYLEAGHEGAAQIWQSIGVYLGYGLAHYADFYDLKHVLILGRVTSGRGGPLILDGAKAVLAAEFPELACSVHIQLPDEKSRRVGQSIAAASLPALKGMNSCCTFENATLGLAEAPHAEAASQVQPGISNPWFSERQPCYSSPTPLSTPPPAHRPARCCSTARSSPRSGRPACPPPRKSSTPPG